MVSVRTFADKANGSIYEMHFANEEAAAAYVPPSDRALIPNRPPPDPSVEAQEKLRAERDRLLSATDWTQIADSPVDKARWAIYRQQLRDLPANTPDPARPSWPRRPDDTNTQAAERELDRAARTVLFDGKN